MAKKKQEVLIDGWLLAWVIATVLIMALTLITNYNNIFGWIIILVLGASLTMMYTKKGSRWFMVVAGAVLGLLWLYTAIKIANNPIGSFGVGLRGGLSVKSMEELSIIATNAIAIAVAYAIYMLASSLYFALSKKVKARFGK